MVCAAGFLLLAGRPGYGQPAAPRYVHEIWTVERGLLANAFDEQVQSRPAPSSRALAERYAEIGKPYIRNYPRSEYGFDAQNFAVAQDERGLIYVGNVGRVLEYDGASWREIALAWGTSVQALARDTDGRIFVGTSGDMGYLAPDSTGQAHFVSLREHVPEEDRALIDVQAVGVTDDGVFFQAPHRLFRWSGGQMRIWTPTSFFSYASVVHGTLYVLQEGVGLMRLEGEVLHLIPGGARFADKEIYTLLPYDSLPQGGETRLLIGTRTHGLFVHDGTAVQPFQAEADAYVRDQIPTCGAALTGGRFALATYRGGVVIIDRRGRLLQVLDKAAGLQSQTVHALFEDREGGLWMALDNGIARADLSSPLSRYPEAMGIQGAVADVVRHRGVLYISTHLGVYALRPRRHAGAAAASLRQPTFRRVEGIDAGAANLVSETLLSTPFGLLTATEDGIYQVTDDRATLILKAEDASSNAFALYRSQQDTQRVFVGLSDGLASLRWEGPEAAGAVSGWVYEGRVAGVDEDVRWLAEQEPGVLWIATKRQGILRLEFAPSERGKRSRPAIRRFDARYGLTMEERVYPTSRHVVFPGGRGILRFDETTDRFVADSSTFGPAFAGSGRWVGNLAEDRRGNVWLNAEGLKGLLRQEDGTYAVDRLPTLLNPTITIGAIYPDPAYDGIVWYGGHEGLFRYDATAEQDRGAGFDALIRRVRVQRDSAVLTRTMLVSASGAAAPASGSGRPSLAYADNALRFEFAAPSYGGLSISEFQYMLEGFDEDWSAWTKETQKDYTNLPEGAYRFRVHARDGYGQMSREAGFAFTILPPWYRSWGAYGVYLFLLGLCVYGLVQLGMRRMHHQHQQEMERVELVTLRELDEAKSRFFANVSHEFRTPLTLTIGPLDDVLDGFHGAIPAPVRGQVALARRNAHRVLGLVNQLLDVAKLDDGRLALRAHEADLTAFVREIGRFFAPLAERRRVALTLDLPDEPVPICFDPLQLEKAVVNLLSNAFKYTPEGAAVRLTVEPDEPGGRVRIIVCDTGPGIAADQLALVFERFYQADESATRLQAGTGIGLALAKELVDLHGGALTVESEVGTGSTFTITLPLGRDHLASEQIVEPRHEAGDCVDVPGLTKRQVEALLSAPAAPAAPAGEADALPLGSLGRDEADQDVMTVLVVEDNAEVRTYLRMHLAQRYRVVEAIDGVDGLAKAPRLLPDLVLSDVMMPGMDGYALCRTLKADPATDFIPVFLLTAKAGQEDRIEGLHEQADDYLTKPFDVRELTARVDNLIASRKRLLKHFVRNANGHAGTPGDLGAAAPPAQSTPDLDPGDLDFLEAVRAAVQAYLDDEDFGVDALAGAVAVSRSTLYRKLGTLLDRTPQALLREARLARAAGLLEARAGGVGEIAYAVGFKSVAHFSRAFHAHYGVPPSAYDGSTA